MTVNALQPSAKLLGQQRYTQNDLMVDPLIVLRCNRRVYRSEDHSFFSCSYDGCLVFMHIFEFRGIISGFV